MKRLCLILFGIILFADPAFSQTYPTKYRPPNLNWQQLQTPHFTIVFPEGEDSVAQRAARILEHEYLRIQQLVGGKLSDFPVVLNNFNDRSNGFVTSSHFRSEVEIPTIKGKTMNPQSGNWLETVLPHELVHALQYSHLEGLWANLIKVFSPDAARSILGSIPSGVSEGIATYHETTGVAPDGGRGNYPYFSNQFDAAFESSNRWSLGEMLNSPSYSRPFDRHYIGGYEFTNWLHQTHGDSTTHKALDFFVRWPFLGYGVALRHTTGRWPAQLYNRFKDTKQKQIAEEEITYESLHIPFKGADMHRPRWLSDEELVIYGSFYNASPGFYRFTLSDSSLTQLFETRSLRDYNYDLSADRSTLLFSNYRTSPYYDNTYKMDLHQADLASGTVEKMTDNIRAFAPVYHEETIFALQTDHESTSLVRLNQNDSTFSITGRIALASTEFISINQNPNSPDQLAVVANRRGLQGLWLVDKGSIKEEIKQAPDVSFMDGSVFDPAWHPSGRRLMFSSDHTGTMQLYEYNLEATAITQLTEASYNAMEGSYSPGGDRIAFVIQHHNERLPVVLDRSRFANRRLAADLWRPSPEKNRFMDRPELGADLKEKSTSWTSSKYRSNGKWLLPRTIAPAFSEISNRDTYQLGVSLSSNDLLLRNSYQMDFTFVQDRMWYDFTYRHKGFFPGFRLNTYSKPNFNTVTLQNEQGPDERVTFLRQDLGLSLGVPTRFVLENNVRYTSVGFTPSLELRGSRFFELDHDGSAASSYANFATANLFAFFNYKIQQNIRDLQPNSGLSFFAELERSLSAGSTTIQTEQYNIDVDFSELRALRSNLYWYAAPLKRWNQSLRVGVEGLTQRGFAFDNQSVVSGGFSEPVFETARHLLSFNTRYTVPLFYPDNGGFQLPVYFSNIYLVGFTDTVADLDNHGINDFFSHSRSVFGIGLRTRFRISNLTFDLGVGVGYEPTRNSLNPFAGNF
ncbi:MAG: hypothetical protein U5K69_13590 [Balneolaceae bacterium]|nr:hypothetical protein [Balneolaceae bacterium]